MATSAKQQTVLCTCFVCGFSGQMVSDRTRRRHSAEQCQATATEPDPTPAISLADLIFDDPKLNAVIVGDFTVLDIVRSFVKIKADNPSVSIEVLDEFLDLTTKIIGKFGADITLDRRYLLKHYSRELSILEHGIEVFDADSERMILLKVKLEIVCADGPAFSEVHKIPHATAKNDACARCTIVAVRNSTLKKQIFTTDQILPRESPDYDIVRSMLFSNTPNRVIDYVSQFGKKGVETFAELSYFDGSCYAIDPMHAGRNFVVRIYSILDGHSDSNSLQAEIEAGRFEAAVEYSLSKDGRKLAHDKYASIVIPRHLFDAPDALFGKKFPNLKSHTWIRLLTAGILVFCTEGLIPRKQWDALRELTRLFRLVMSPNIKPDMNFSSLQADLVSCVKAVQDTFPLTLRTLQLHLLCHFASQLEEFGPMLSYWMFGSERYMCWLMRRVKQNRAHPEATAVNGYCLRWATTLLAAVCEPESILAPAASKLRTKKDIELSPSELSTIAACWNATQKEVLITSPSQVQLNTSCYESCDLHSVVMIKKNDYVYILHDGQHIAGKVILFCEIEMCNISLNFALFHKLIPIPDLNSAFLKYHVDQICSKILCIPVADLTVSKPLVFVPQGLSSVIIVSGCDYIFPNNFV